MYDAFGNFEYGATGEAMGISCNTLVGWGNLLHNGHNNPINTQDIVDGYNAVYSGGTLKVVNYNPKQGANNP
jgi:hypothetical protein